MTQQTSRQCVFPPEIAPYIDVAAYLLDARAPAATLYFEQLLLGKELLLLTRSDLADPAATRQWQKYCSECGYPCIIIDGKQGTGFEEVLDYLAQLLKRKEALSRRRNIQSATLRIAALGVPNVGKSTFLNKLIGRHKLKTGDRPGITRGRQWVRLFEDVEVLDTPGILRDPALLRGRKLTWMLLNLMPYDYRLREEVIELYLAKAGQPGIKRAAQFYNIDLDRYPCTRWLSLLEQVGQTRGFRVTDDEGLDRAARQLLRDFQLGRLGRLSLQRPGQDAITSPYFKQRAKAE